MPSFVSVIYRGGRVYFIYKKEVFRGICVCLYYLIFLKQVGAFQWFV